MSGAVLLVDAEAERIVGNRLWAVFMLARSPETARSVLAGLPVMARNLDAEALRRALRGAPLPDPAAFLVVSHEMLDAISEAGSLTVSRRTRR